MVFSVGDFFTNNLLNEAYIIIEVKSVASKDLRDFTWDLRDTSYKVYRLHDGLIKTKFHYELSNPHYWTKAT